MSAPPLLAVALETSTRRPSVAVQVRGQGARGRELEAERAHAGDLLSVLAELLRELDLAARDIEALVVGIGPGSYTGLRVGLAAALGLARGSGARVRAVPSGEALAFERLAPGERGVQLLDARQGELYFASYERTPDDVRTLDGPRIVRPAQLVLPEQGPILGDADVARAAALGPADRARLEAGAVPGARALLELGLSRLGRLGPQDVGALRPLYLRPFRALERRR